MGSNKNRNKTVKKPRALCQCYNQQTGKACARSATQDTLFCQEHQNCPNAPLSGSEPSRDAELYNKASVRRCHNCYSYAMHVYDPEGERLCKKYGNCRNFFHQPGAKTGHRDELNREERRSCPVVEKLMMGDIPEVTKVSYDQKCSAGMSKVAAVVDKGVDYHWYRQDKNGMWSHKDGSNKVKTYDALKRPIFNPELASRDYRWQGSDLNYEDFCGFYCVPRNHPVVLGRGVNAPKARKAPATRRTLSKARKMQGGQRVESLPLLMQTGRGRATRAQRGHGYDIRLNSLPGCPPVGGRRARVSQQRGQGYDVRLDSLPPQSGMGLSWTDYPPHSTDSLRK